MRPRYTYWEIPGVGYGREREGAPFETYYDYKEEPWIVCEHITSRLTKYFGGVTRTTLLRMRLQEGDIPD